MRRRVASFALLQVQILHLLVDVHDAREHQLREPLHDPTPDLEPRLRHVGRRCQQPVPAEADRGLLNVLLEHLALEPRREHGALLALHAQQRIRLVACRMGVEELANLVAAADARGHVVDAAKNALHSGVVRPCATAEHDGLERQPRAELAQVRERAGDVVGQLLAVARAQSHARLDRLDEGVRRVLDQLLIDVVRLGRRPEQRRHRPLEQRCHYTSPSAAARRQASRSHPSWPQAPTSIARAGD